MANSIFDERTAETYAIVANNGSGTGNNTLVASRAQPVRLDHILVSNSDTIAHEVTFNILQNNSLTIIIGSISIPARTGYDGTPSIDVVPVLTSVTLDGIVLKYNDSLRFALTVAMVGATVMDVLGMGGLL